MYFINRETALEPWHIAASLNRSSLHLVVSSYVEIFTFRHFTRCILFVVKTEDIEIVISSKLTAPTVYRICWCTWWIS